MGVGGDKPTPARLSCPALLIAEEALTGPIALPGIPRYITVRSTCVGGRLCHRVACHDDESHSHNNNDRTSTHTDSWEIISSGFGLSLVFIVERVTL